MGKVPDAEVRSLIEQLIAHGYEPNEVCENPVCQLMARMQARITNNPAKVASNGHKEH